MIMYRWTTAKTSSNLLNGAHTTARRDRCTRGRLWSFDNHICTAARLAMAATKDHARAAAVQKAKAAIIRAPATATAPIIEGQRIIRFGVFNCRLVFRSDKGPCVDIPECPCCTHAVIHPIPHSATSVRKSPLGAQIKPKRRKRAASAKRRRTHGIHSQRQTTREPVIIVFKYLFTSTAVLYS